MTRSPLSKGYEQLRALLVEARKQSNLTQADLAQRLGRPQSFVSKYERGERRLDVIEFLQVVQLLGANPLEIIGQLENEAMQ